MGSRASNVMSSSILRCRTGRRCAFLLTSRYTVHRTVITIQYLPTFAAVMVPFTMVPKRVAEAAWFTLTVAMAWGLVQLAIAALPGRRLSLRLLFWVVLLLNGKFLVKELAFGQFNLPVALLLLGAVISARYGRGFVAAIAIAAAVFVKPYALRPAALAVMDIRLAIGVGVRIGVRVRAALPAASYGWNGNLTLLHDWYRTVADTTAPNLLGLTTFRSPRCGRSGSGRARSPFVLHSPPR